MKKIFVFVALISLFSCEKECFAPNTHEAVESRAMSTSGGSDEDNNQSNTSIVTPDDPTTNDGPIGIDDEDIEGITDPGKKKDKKNN